MNAVFSGHEHAYERIKPEDGIYFFVPGSSGMLVRDDFHRHDVMQTSYDRDRTFMLVEIDGDKFYFQTISRGGESIDSGELPRQAKIEKMTVVGR